MAQRRPSREKLYAAMTPMVAISRAAGMAADGASPNAAMPCFLHHVGGFAQGAVMGDICERKNERRLKMQKKQRSKKIIRNHPGRYNRCAVI
jgi:hypothetical protein